MIIAAAFLSLAHAGAGCLCHMHMPVLAQDAPQEVRWQDWPKAQALPDHVGETRLANVRQLTFGGQNAEAYWSPNGRQIVYQSRQPGFPDEQIFVMDADGGNRRLVSTGLGRCTCSYFSPDGKWVYFSSTHAKDAGAQKPVDMSKGYVWMVNPNFAMYRLNLTQPGAKPEPVLAKDGYVAETTIAPNGKYMTWTGNFEGDPDIYRSDMNGRNIVKLTDEVGYDGGPFVSWDSRSIVYRRDAIENDTELSDYRALLAENLVRPGKLEIFMMDASGKNKRQITNLGAASFAPFLHPNNREIIFSSNYGDPKGREFDLFVVNVDGSGLRRITKSGDFDGFPMFTRDGKHLVFASNRNGNVRGETNVFVADWVSVD
ncbi:MAG: PD40 domain-containing protein [Chthonomonas sp.]|nr:PD40 domain-containing protein [Chthonomonas sp.]